MIAFRLERDLARLAVLQRIELIGPNRASMFIQLMPLFSAVMAILIFNEKFELYHFAGASFILTGIYLSNRKIRA